MSTNSHKATYSSTDSAAGFAANAPRVARFFLFASLAVLPACAPKIYVIDRQTVLEEEAAGHWPQFEKDIVTKSMAEGPTPFLKTPFNARREKLLNVLNGELASSTAE